MKRIIPALLALIVCLSGCSLVDTPADKTAASLGDYTQSTVYTQGEEQTVEYGKYFYAEAKPLDSKAFTRALSTDIVTVKPYIDDFEKKLQALDRSGDVAKNYDYDYSSMEKGDFFYITDRDGSVEDSSFTYYSFYIFDRSDNILYYFHAGN